jgi:hypothetical protein
MGMDLFGGDDDYWAHNAWKNTPRLSSWIDDSGKFS